MADEHPIKQEIRRIVVEESNGVREAYDVGRWDVSRIEATTKSGMYSNIPYIRVWRGDFVVAEFCQHNILGVYFAKPEEASEHE